MFPFSYEHSMSTLQLFKIIFYYILYISRKICLSHSILYCCSIKKGKLCWTPVHFCSPTNRMVGQRRERERIRRAAGNPPFLCQNLSFILFLSFAHIQNPIPDDLYNTGITSCCLLVPGSNRTQSQTRVVVCSCLPFSVQVQASKESK